MDTRECGSYGFIYVLSNPSMPGIYKIGVTTISGHARAYDLSKSTGVPSDFKVEFESFTPNRYKVESQIHKHLDKYRVSPKKEFFKLDIQEIVREVIRSSQEVPVEPGQWISLIRRGELPEPEEIKEESEFWID